MDANGNPLECLSVGPGCPVQRSLYGYYPSLPANAFFLAFFAVCMIANTILGTWKRTWTYLIAMFFGCLAQVIGYAGRIIMNDNPFNMVGFQIQICCLTLAPAFNSAAIYLTSKHITLCFGPESSRVPPKWYTWAFITTDILALIFQGAGGGSYISLCPSRNFSDPFRNRNCSDSGHRQLPKHWRRLDDDWYQSSSCNIGCFRIPCCRLHCQETERFHSSLSGSGFHENVNQIPPLCWCFVHRLRSYPYSMCLPHR